MLKKLTKDKILIVEGTHEKKFFTVLSTYLNLQDIQIVDIGGNIFDSIICSLSDELLKRTSIGIMTDADINSQRIFNSIRNTLIKAHLPYPDFPNTITASTPKVSVFIFPDNNNKGALEDLCIESIKDTPELSCVESYFNCLNAIDPVLGTNHPHISKAKVQVFLAKEEEGDIHMGISAEKNCWDWNNPSFFDIKSFLTTLFA